MGLKRDVGLPPHLFHSDLQADNFGYLPFYLWVYPTHNKKPTPTCRYRVEVSSICSLCFYNLGNIVSYAFTICPKSGFKDAPPISPPSISGFARSSAALPAFMEPPYWMRTASAVASSYISAMQSRMPLHTS